MIGSYVDSLLARPFRDSRQRRALGTNTRLIDNPAGRLRVYDSGGQRPAIIFTPDGPCVIEHFQELIPAFEKEFRVICFDMPGFGFSWPAPGYGFGSYETADAVAALMDSLGMARATIAFSCANGFSALALAQKYPARVSRLILCQTPSPVAMNAWSERTIPPLLRLPVVGQLTMLAAKKKFSRTWFNAALPRHSPHTAMMAERAHSAVCRGGGFCLASLVQGLGNKLLDPALSVDCPVLAIHGSQDYSHKLTDFHSIHDLVPHARTVAFANCGHCPELEDTPRYTREVCEFVATQ